MDDAENMTIHWRKLDLIHTEHFIQYMVLPSRKYMNDKVSIHKIRNFRQSEFKNAEQLVIMIKNDYKTDGYLATHTILISKWSQSLFLVPQNIGSIIIMW